MALTKPPSACPKCTSDRGWEGPHYRGSTCYAHPAALRELPRVLVDGCEYVSLDAAVALCGDVHEVLEWGCKSCGWSCRGVCADYQRRTLNGPE